MRLVFLGTAQDAGIPQAGCECENCRNQFRTAASIALVNDDNAIIFDLSPDFRIQYNRLRQKYPFKLKALYLTHAHWGHYGGLQLLGNEGWSTHQLPVYLSSSFAGFIRGNNPFAQLEKDGNIILNSVESGKTTPDSVRFIKVPHREEYSDTHGFQLPVQNKKLLYLPCFDLIPNDIETLIFESDLTILDGTFYSDDELCHRDIKKIPHPRVNESVQRFRDISEKIIFTHFNHTNPLVNPDSKQRKYVVDQGFRIAEEMQELVI